MAYIGKQPIVGNYQVLDSLTATTTDTYALTKNSVAVFPQTPANCIVSLNGVIQAPFDSYTISGSNIVFASALTASDSIDFITVLGDVLNVGTVSDGTIGLAKLSATGTKDATTFLRGDNTFAVPAGGVNTPAWSATVGSDQAITSNTSTIIQFNTENFDVGSVFNTSTYKATPTSGKYFISFVCNFQSTSASVRQLLFRLYKNTSAVASSGIFSPSNIFENGTYNAFSASGVFSANGTDTFHVEVYYYDGSGNIKANAVSYPQIFSGFKIIE